MAQTHWATSGKGHSGQETEKARLCIPQVEQDLFHVKYNFLIFYMFFSIMLLSSIVMLLWY